MGILQKLCAALMLAACTALAQASMIHKWVDADGLTHYSDEPPPGNVTDIEQIEMPASPAHDRANSADAYYSIANQWRRMHRERIEIERMRAERASGKAVDSRDGDTIVIQAPESRPLIKILPRHRPGWMAPLIATPPARRHPLAFPGRDWPVGLHPGRMRLRGGFDSR